MRPNQIGYMSVIVKVSGEASIVLQELAKIPKAHVAIDEAQVWVTVKDGSARKPEPRPLSAITRGDASEIEKDIPHVQNRLSPEMLEGLYRLIADLAKLTKT